MGILEDVGEMWNNLTDIDKSAIATSLGGTYQRNTLMSILENWDEVKEAQEVAADSLGSTEQKYADYMDSIEAHLNQLSTTWSQFLLNLDVSGKANAVIGAINGIVKVLDFLINKTPVATIAVTALVAALTRLVAVNLGKFANSMISFANSIMGLSNGKGALGGIFSFFTTGAFSKGMGTATKEMGNLAKGGTAVAKAMSQGGAQFASFGKAATAAMTGATASTVGTTTAVTSLGAALATVGKMLGVIGLIGGAIWAASTIIDKLITTDEELEESIQTHKDSISEMESTIEDYNITLEANKDRIEEINSLKGTSEWSGDLESEAEMLEQQNALLEKQIALEERKKELEAEELLEEQKEQFDRDYGENAGGIITGVDPTTGMTVDKYYEGKDYVLKNWEKETQSIKDYLSYIDQADQALKEGNEELSDQYRARAEALENDALEAEQHMVDQIEYLQEYKKILEDTNEDTSYVDSLLEVAYAMQSMEGIDITIGDTLGVELNNAAESAKSLSEQLKEIADVDIVPKDFDDMESWLETLTDQEFSALQNILEACDGAGQTLSDTLSSMGGEEAANLLNQAYKNFYGTLDNASEKLSAFQTAYETDYDEQLSQVADAANYITRYRNGLESNFQAYKVALDVIGLSTSDSIDRINEKLASTRQYIGSDGTQRNYQTFLKNVSDLSNDAAKNLSDFSDTIVEVQRSSADTSTTDNIIGIKVNDVAALAKALDLSETEAQALLNGLKQFGDVEINPSMTLLQKNLRDTYQQIEELDERRKKIFETGFTDSEGTFISAKGATEGAAELKEMVDQLNQIAQERYGIKFDIEYDDSNLGRLQQELKETSENYQNFFSNAGELDVSKVEETINTVNQILDEEHQLKFDVDTQTIEGVTSETIGALNDAFGGDTGLTSMIISSLEGGLGNIDWNSIIGDGTSIGSTIAQQIQTNLSNIVAPEDQAWSQAFISAASDAGVQIVDLITDAINTASNVDGRSAALDTISSQATSTATQIAAVAAALSSLKSQADSAVSYVKSQIKSIPTSIPFNPLGSATGSTDIQGYATGGIYGYEDGKDPQGRNHLMTLNDTNAMVGEVAPEMVVHKNGQTEMVGENGAEFVHLDKGDTVLPANVTKMIQDGDIGSYPTGASATFGGKVANKNNSSVTVTVNGASNVKTGSSSSSSSKSSSSSSGNSSSSESSEDPAEDLIAEVQHRLNMEYITEKQYATELKKIWGTYYKDKEEFRDKDWKYQEELYDLQKKFDEEWINAQEYNVGILERRIGTEQQQIKIYQQMQDKVHQMADAYRAKGYDDNSKEIRELSEQWWDYYDSIKDLETNMFDSMQSDIKHHITMIDHALEAIPEALEKGVETAEDLSDRLDAYYNSYADLAEQKIIQYKNQYANIQTQINKLTKEGYDLNKEQLQDLEDQAASTLRNIKDVYQELKDIKLDNIDKQLNLEDSIVAGMVDYAEEYISNIESENEGLQGQIDALEKANDERDKANKLEQLKQNLQKAQDAYDNAKNNKVKRVYHAETG